VKGGAQPLKCFYQKQADVLACVQKYVKITPEQAVSIKGTCERESHAWFSKSIAWGS